MSNVKELLDEAIYKCACLTPNEENRLYKWVESLEVAKRKTDEYEAKAQAFDEIRSARQIVLEGVRARGTKLPSDFDKFTLLSERIINKYESGDSYV